MENLIKISENELGIVSSARDLHLALQVKTDFTTWIKRMLEYGFIEIGSNLSILILLLII